MDAHRLRSVLPFLYVIAILIAIFVGGGQAVAATAVIGAVALAAGYTLLRGQPSSGRDRGRDRRRYRSDPPSDESG